VIYEIQQASSKYCAKSPSTADNAMEWSANFPDRHSVNVLDETQTAARHSLVIQQLSDITACWTVRVDGVEREGRWSGLGCGLSHLLLCQRHPSSSKLRPEGLASSQLHVCSWSSKTPLHHAVPLSRQYSPELEPGQNNWPVTRPDPISMNMQIQLQC